MKTLGHLIVLLAACLLFGACGGAQMQRSQHQPDWLAVQQAAFEQDRRADFAKAFSDATALLAAAASSPDPDAPIAIANALDLLVFRTSAGLKPVLGHHGLAFAVPDGISITLAQLESAYHNAARPNAVAARLLLSRAALILAEFQGNIEQSHKWLARSASVPTATVLGPLTASAVTALPHAYDFERSGQPMVSSFAGIAPAYSTVVAQLVRANGPTIPLGASGAAPGLRAAVIDIDVPSSTPIAIAVGVRRPAEILAANSPVLRIATAPDSQPLWRAVWLTAQPGWLRVSVHVAVASSRDELQLVVMSSDGVALATRAPSAGQTAPSQVLSHQPLDLAGLSPRIGPVLSANALLVWGDSRRAEALCDQVYSRSRADPAMLLVYARALETGSALPEPQRIERLRQVYEQALAAEPLSWQAAIGTAVAAGQRKPGKPGPIEALTRLAQRSSSLGNLDPMSEAYRAHVAMDAGMFDLADQSLGNLSRMCPSSALRLATAVVVKRSSGAHAAVLACNTDGLDKSALACFQALSEIGEARRAHAELDRLRTLKSAPDDYRVLDGHLALVSGDGAAALAAYDAIPVALRTASLLGAGAEKAEEQALLRLRRDFPYWDDSVSPVLDFQAAQHLASGMPPDPAVEEMVATDRANPVMPGAALLVLEHRESIEVDSRGVVRYSMLDVRRVSGTTDVASGAEASMPAISGQNVERQLRHRVFKSDGRVLEPDAAHNSEQASELSQLEPGDYVQLDTEGIALPGLSGETTIETADLMPPRTSVWHAEMSLRAPETSSLVHWGHPLLTSSATVKAGMNTRVWTLQRQAPRRIEQRVSQWISPVAVRASTLAWTMLADALAERVASSECDDDVVAQFAKKAVAGTTSDPAAMMERIARAVTKTVRVASGAVLGDSMLLLAPGGEPISARRILELGQGSRVWLAAEAARAVGIHTEIAVAESSPYPDDPGFPAHAGRFDHPLLSFTGKSGAPVWMDLDVPGPGLPLGQISPELLGRKAIAASRGIFGLPSGQQLAPPDEVNLELALDREGGAHGRIQIIIRGQAAQTLSDAFETIVGNERQRWLRAIVLAWTPWADVDQVTAELPETTSELRVRAELSTSALVRDDDPFDSIPGLAALHPSDGVGKVGSLGGWLGAQAGRDSELAIDSSVRYVVRRSIDLGQDWELVKAPEPQTFTDSHVVASRTSTLTGTVIADTFELEIRTGSVGVGEYQEFSSRLRQIDDAFGAALRVRKIRRAR